MSAWHTVHVRINDAASGQPVPVRISFHAQGQFLAPLGRSVDFPVESGIDAGGHVEIGPERFHYIDGHCEIRLPPGEVAIQLWHGPEYVPIRHVVELAPGQISLRLGIQRFLDLRELGWYSGDTHVVDVRPYTALLEGGAEDVAVVNLLAHQRETQAIAPNLLAFSGQGAALERSGTLVAVNTLNRHPDLGELILLNCHRIVFPLRSGDDGLGEWTLADWCDQCHRKKTGLVLWGAPASSQRQQEEPVAGAPCWLTRQRSEALADLILGKIDGFEILGFDAAEPTTLAAWYQLLAAGFRVPLVGGSGKGSAARAIGRVRTYAWIGPGKQLDYASWIDAVRAGRTFVTNGPLVLLSVDELGPGSVIEAEPGQAVRLRAEARTVLPIERLELLVNGMIGAAKEAAGNRQSAIVETEWEADRSAWIVARCVSSEPLPDGQVIFAQTSPAYVDVQGRPFQPVRPVVESLLGHLDHMLDWVVHHARCAEEAHRERATGVFSSARAALIQRMAQDGQEASPSQ
jgi:hypothetical protein